ncbi:hypothetical protein ASC75_24660 [Aminobacter sp. DSM 101952]|nr:hypothetical protein ASC75_24660 [Aminobacter sp. DSM 101952]
MNVRNAIRSAADWQLFAELTLIADRRLAAPTTSFQLSTNAQSFSGDIVEGVIAVNVCVAAMSYIGLYMTIGDIGTYMS